MRALLLSAGLALAAMPAAAAPVTDHEPLIGAAFTRSVSQTAEPCRDTPRCVQVSTGKGRKAMPFLMLQAVDEPLEKAAREEAGFERKDGRWMTTYGRFEPQPVQAFKGRGWTGPRAVITCGVSDGNGFHAAGGECLWAVVSDGRRTIVASTEGLADVDAAFATLATLAFDP